MPTAKCRPLVGVTACLRPSGDLGYHIVGDKYVRAVSGGADCLPMLVPALGDWHDPEDLADRVDGILLTGSPSDVEPHHYAGPPAPVGLSHDPLRDATTLPLIRHALRRGTPVLAVCRGIQELNVALGGSLHQRLHEVPERRDHRGRKDLDTAGRYATGHTISIRPDGPLAALLGKTETYVNSLHGQGIDRLAETLVAEATAPDGTVEAVSMPDAPGFVLGVQWHPEWRYWENADSEAIFKAFGDACRACAANRTAAAAQRVA
ncbi:MAG: gamma-glutamyl-gamma-aminobutyrate hydrolase family protein [Rhodospirillaceae bacterium]|jgi:putative glutamine amidotransferase|nr:gamma-glutamyl-gamma-aminobutyrate hydrolase family protein [Rhodospirillaceae bacterium]